MNQGTTTATNDIALFKSGAEFLTSFELRHFYISMTYFVGNMGITAGTLSQAILLGKGLNPAQTLKGESSGVEYFNNIDLL